MKKILIAFSLESNQPIYVTLDNLAVTAIGGLQGGGKTTTAQFLGCQYAMLGAKIVMCDPDGHASLSSKQQTMSYNLAPLESAYAVAPAIEHSDIAKSVKYVHSILSARITGKSADITPIWLVIDEFSTLMRDQSLAPIIIALLEDVATRGRKYHVNVAICGQQWHVDRSGGGAFKDLITAAIVHRMAKKTARLLTGVTSIPETMFMRSGECYIMLPNGIEHCAVPRTTYSDVVRVGEIISKRASQIKQIDPLLAQMLETPLLNAEQKEVLELFGNGLDISDIVKQKYNLTSNNNRPYTSKVKEVNSIIRNNYHAK